MKKIYSFCFTIAGILVAAGAVFIYEAFEKKMHYSYSEDYPSLNQNAYVVGDAYNYIINANYFIGYGILGCSAIVCATMLICVGIYLVSRNEARSASAPAAPAKALHTGKPVHQELPPL